MDGYVRDAEPRDAGAIAAIYNQGIEERQATFETEPRSAEDFAAALSAEQLLLVAADSERILGWARLGPYSSRPCYSGVGEASIYVERGARGRGIARMLFEALAERAQDVGSWKIIGLLFPTNRASVALCRAVGCREVGTFRRHGQLDGEWRDVLIVERVLGAAAKEASDSQT